MHTLIISITNIFIILLYYIYLYSDFNSNKNLNMIIGSVLFNPIFALENNILNYSMITNLRYESFTKLLNIKRPISIPILIPNQENTIFSFPTLTQSTEPKQLYNGGISRKKNKKYNNKTHKSY
jgi:hypothetical protein